MDFDLLRELSALDPTSADAAEVLRKFKERAAQALQRLAVEPQPEVSGFVAPAPVQADPPATNPPAAPTTAAPTVPPAAASPVATPDVPPQTLQVTTQTNSSESVPQSQISPPVPPPIPLASRRRPSPALQVDSPLEAPRPTVLAEPVSLIPSPHSVMPPMVPQASRIMPRRPTPLSELRGASAIPLPSAAEQLERQLAQERSLRMQAEARAAALESSITSLRAQMDTYTGTDTASVMSGDSRASTAFTTYSRTGPGPTHLAFLYSAPLVLKVSVMSNETIPIEPLDLTDEKNLIFDSLRECGKAVRVCMRVATADSLRILLDSGCTALHFTGHGGIDASGNDYIVFEDRKGAAHLLYLPTLARLLNSGRGSYRPPLPEDPPERASPLQLVFVASCHSHRIGELFISAGVHHVVCVRREEKILDAASAVFARAFYHALFAGRTVPQAFEVAQARVNAESELPSGESDKFELLLHPIVQQRPELSDIQLFGDIPLGRYVDTSPRVLFQHLPALAEHFVGRQDAMFAVLGLVVKQRLVTVRGPPGIGKTTLCKHVASFVAQRRMFTDGAMFISLRGVLSQDALVSTVYREMAASNAGLIDNDRAPMGPLMQASVERALKDLHVLLVLDNMEDPLNADGKGVREWIRTTLEACPGASFLITSRQSVGGGITGVTEKVYNLTRLSRSDAARLFIRLAPRQLDSRELFPHQPHRLRFSIDDAVEALSQHRIMDFLDGHPQAIALATPLLQDRNLRELEDALARHGVGQLAVVDLPPDEQSAMNTLVASLEVSIDHLRKRHPDAVALFALMGLLPGGALDSDFDGIWGNGVGLHRVQSWTWNLESSDHGPAFVSNASDAARVFQVGPADWRPLVDILCRASLIERRQWRGGSAMSDYISFLKKYCTASASATADAQSYYSTFPFVTNFAEQLLGPDRRPGLLSVATPTSSTPLSFQHGAQTPPVPTGLMLPNHVSDRRQSREDLLNRLGKVEPPGSPIAGIARDSAPSSPTAGPVEAFSNNANGGALVDNRVHRAVDGILEDDDDGDDDKGNEDAGSPSSEEGSDHESDTTESDVAADGAPSDGEPDGEVPAAPAPPLLVHTLSAEIPAGPASPTPSRIPQRARGPKSSLGSTTSAPAAGSPPVTALMVVAAPTAAPAPAPALAPVCEPPAAGPVAVAAGGATPEATKPTKLRSTRPPTGSDRTVAGTRLTRSAELRMINARNKMKTMQEQKAREEAPAPLPSRIPKPSTSASSTATVKHRRASSSGTTYKSETSMATASVPHVVTASAPGGASPALRVPTPHPIMLAPSISFSGGMHKLTAMRLDLEFATDIHFAHVSEWIFKHLGTLSKRSQVAFTLSEIHELNFWACLERATSVLQVLAHSQVRPAGSADGDANEQKDKDSDSDVESPPRPPSTAPAGDNVEGPASVAGPSAVASPVPPALAPDFATPNESTLSLQSIHPNLLNRAIEAAKSLVLLGVHFAQSLLIVGRNKDGLQAARTSMEVAMAADDKLGQANVHKVLGLLYLQMHNFEASVEELRAARRVYHTLGCTVGVACIYSALAHLHQLSGNLQPAYETSTKSLELYTKVDHSLGKACVLRRLGGLCMKLPNMKDKAYKFYADARRIQGAVNRTSSSSATASSRTIIGDELNLHMEIMKES